MGLPAFRLHSPKSVEEACRILADRGEEAVPIAGGTAVLILMKSGLAAPPHLVSLWGLRDLAQIRFDPKEGLRIGALCTHRAVEKHPAVREVYPMLADTYRRVANVRVRNRATVGGNLAHGDYRLDPPAPLIALGARLRLRGPEGEREVPLADFFQGFYTVDKRPGEILTEVRVPPPPPGARGMYLKFVGHAAADWPILGVAGLLRASRSGEVEDLRVVLSCVAATPVRVSGVDELAVGRPLTPERIEAVAERAAAEADPIEDARGSAWYKREIIRVQVRRVLERLADPNAHGVAE
ncbi:MAG: xanthine dehydrogenase family protein subunit M [Candidatus Tectomicrobia bacterium]|nr:xanthine dehydrogenase family protein subunit M [Candidatus Tectomicrobia bacterium]